MSNIFFTSDTHFFHRQFTAAGEIKNRPMFKDEYEMNDILVKNWNSIVGKDDLVYHIGDFAVGVENRVKELNELAYSLNGKIHLIEGNHENWAKKHIASRFETIKHYDEVGIKPFPKIILFHYALRVWHHSHKGCWHLYGHSHGDLPEYLGAMSFDIGVDNWDYKPLSIEQVAKVMKEKQDEVDAGRSPDQLIHRKQPFNSVKYSWAHHGSAR